jgi:hypothetical protein
MAEETQDQATSTRTVTLRALPLGEAVPVGILAQRMQVEPVAVIKQLMRILKLHQVLLGRSGSRREKQKMFLLLQRGPSLKTRLLNYQ